MSIRDWIKPRLQDLVMRQMNELRPETVESARGEVLEVGFGTALNLALYGPEVQSVIGVDPMEIEHVESVMRRITDTSFPVKHQTLRADGGLPFDTGRFDTVVTTWTLCSIADARAALGEMRRVLKPGGRYLFIEHGRAPSEGTARWQDRVNPLWNRISDGCNINRQIDRIVEDSGFELTSLDRFRGRGPGLFAHMFRGVATRQA
ncbi:MAG: class I SAM-dependent methyltransferase [Myxococcota bacterium]